MKYPQIRVGDHTFNKHHHSKPIHTDKSDREYIKFRSKFERQLTRFKRKFKRRM